MAETGVVGKLAQALGAGGVYSAWIGLNEPGVAEALAHEDFDALNARQREAGRRRHRKDNLGRRIRPVKLPRQLERDERFTHADRADPKRLSLGLVRRRLRPY